MIDIYDDILDIKDAKYIHNMISSPSLHWRFYHDSVRGKESFHLSKNPGDTDEEIEKNKMGWLFSMWENLMYYGKLQERYGIETYRRIYFNAHTYGMEPLAHKDDGDFTMIYYPRLDWKKEWGGGTAVWEDKNDMPKLADYKGNRLIVFPAEYLHQAQAVSRECYHLRPVIVFKTFLVREDIQQKDKENYLRELGCHKTKHAHGSNLLQHLSGVRDSIRNNGFPQYLQDAGMFHSVYGTTYFKPKITQDRETIRSLIGEKAENLVYLFCNMEHPRKKNIELVEDDQVRKDLLVIEEKNSADMKRRKKWITFLPTVEKIEND